MINETEGTLKYNAANYFMRTETNIVFYRGVRCTFVFLLSSFIFYVLGFKFGFYCMLVCLLSFTFLYVFITCIAAFVRNKLMMIDETMLWILLLRM